MRDVCDDVQLMHDAASVLRTIGYGPALESFEGIAILARETAWGCARGMSPAVTALKVAALIELSRRTA